MLSASRPTACPRDGDGSLNVRSHSELVARYAAQRNTGMQCTLLPYYAALHTGYSYFMLRSPQHERISLNITILCTNKTVHAEEAHSAVSKHLQDFEIPT